MTDITSDPLFQQAVALGLSSAFGLIQFLGQKVPSNWKPQLYVALSCVLSILGYYALHSNVPLIQMLVVAATSGTGVTGAVHFYKNDVQATTVTAPNVTPTV